MQSATLPAAGTAPVVEPVPDVRALELDAALTTSLRCYRAVTRASLTLPPVSVFPLLFLCWKYVKFCLCLPVELYLALPYNAVMLAARLTGRRPRFRSLLWGDLQGVGLWLWRGEGPIAPTFVSRLPVTILVSRHVRRRLLLARRMIALDDRLEEGDRDRLVARIDAALPLWRHRGLLGLAWTVVLPAVGGVSALLPLVREMIHGHALSRIPSAVWFGVALAMIYVVPIAPGFFMAKRGLMLGRTGRGAYFPGGTSEHGVYDTEDGLLQLVGLRRREFPTDLALYLVYPLLCLVGGGVLLRQRDYSGAATYAGFAAVFAAFFGLALWRRARTNRW
jgi:hypothetical protein